MSKTIPFIILLFVLSGCPPKAVIETQPVAPSLPEVSLVNIQKMLSTYDISKKADAVNAIKAVPGITQTELDNILKYSTETNWPANLGTVSARYQNKEIIKTYKAYKVTSFPDGKGGTLNLIKIPAYMNTAMPTGYTLSSDIYFVMTGEGFKSK